MTELSDIQIEIQRRKAMGYAAIAKASETELRRRYGERPPSSHNPVQVTLPKRRAALVAAERKQHRGMTAPDISPQAQEAMIALVADIWDIDRARHALPWTTASLAEARAALVALARDVTGAQDAAIVRWLGNTGDTVARSYALHSKLIVQKRGYRIWYSEAETALREWLGMP